MKYLKTYESFGGFNSLNEHLYTGDYIIPEGSIWYKKGHTMGGCFEVTCNDFGSMTAWQPDDNRGYASTATIPPLMVRAETREGYKDGKSVFLYSGSGHGSEATIWFREFTPYLEPKNSDNALLDYDFNRMINNGEIFKVTKPVRNEEEAERLKDTNPLKTGWSKINKVVCNEWTDVLVKKLKEMGGEKEYTESELKVLGDFWNGREVNKGNWMTPFEYEFQKLKASVSHRGGYRKGPNTHEVAKHFGLEKELEQILDKYNLREISK